MSRDAPHPRPTAISPLLRYLNLSLLVLFPLSWFAPLLNAGLLPIFGTARISVITGLQSLWETDVFFALLVTFFAILAPYLKTIGLAMIHFGMMRRRVLPFLHWMGKLAMADVFMIALYVTVFKKMGVGSVETAWGLYFFTFCIVLSLMISTLSEKKPARTTHYG